MTAVNRIITMFRQKFFPTEHDRILQKWYANEGDATLRLDYDLDDKATVLDMGGFMGQWASDIYAKYLCRVFVFEPAQRFADIIEKRFQSNPSIETHRFGLGNSTRTETLHLCGNASSIFRNSDSAERVKIVDAKDWFRENRIGQVNLIKINIEGGEYELLERLIETGLITIIRNIQVQFHDLAKDSSSRMEALQRKLEQTHRLTYQYRFVWENWILKNS